MMIDKVRKILNFGKKEKKCDQIKRRIDMEIASMQGRIEDLTRMAQGNTQRTVKM